jgi:hypothetical protein
MLRRHNPRNHSRRLDRKPVSVFYAFSRRDSLIEEMFYVSHLQDHVGPIYHFLVSAASCQDQFDRFRLFVHDVQEILDFDKTEVNRHVEFVKDHQVVLPAVIAERAYSMAISAINLSGESAPLLRMNPFLPIGLITKSGRRALAARCSPEESGTLRSCTMNTLSPLLAKPNRVQQWSFHCRCPGRPGFFPSRTSNPTYVCRICDVMIKAAILPTNHSQIKGRYEPLPYRLSLTSPSSHLHAGFVPRFHGGACLLK